MEKHQSYVSQLPPHPHVASAKTSDKTDNTTCRECGVASVVLTGLSHTPQSSVPTHPPAWTQPTVTTLRHLFLFLCLVSSTSLNGNN